MHCERIPTIKLINTSITSHTFFMRRFKIYFLLSQQISIIQQSIINYSHHAIHQILRTYSSYISKFVPFFQPLKQTFISAGARSPTSFRIVQPQVSLFFSQLAHSLRRFREAFLVSKQPSPHSGTQSGPLLPLLHNFFFLCPNFSNASCFTSPENFPLTSQLPGNKALCLDSSLLCHSWGIVPREVDLIQAYLVSFPILRDSSSKHMFLYISPIFTYFYKVSTSAPGVCYKWVIFFWKKKSTNGVQISIVFYF